LCIIGKEEKEEYFVALGACRRYYYDLELLHGQRS